MAHQRDQHFAEGTWRLDRSENFDQYSKHMGFKAGNMGSYYLSGFRLGKYGIQTGVPWVKRMLSKLIYTTQTITVDQDTWNIVTSSAVKRMYVQLTAGEECTWLTYDGRKIRTTVEAGDRELILDQLDPPFAKMTRQFDGETMVMTLEASGMKARRIYKKLDTPAIGQCHWWPRALFCLSVCAVAVCAVWYYNPHHWT